MSMVKDMAKLKEWKENTEKYLESSSSLLGQISEQGMAQSMLPPLRVLKFYMGALGDMVSRNEPKRASIGEDGGMYTVSDNVVSIQSHKKRAERWSSDGAVHLIEVE